MKMILMTSMIALLGATAYAQSQSKDISEVEVVVEELRRAMVDGNKQVLEKIGADELTYGHSNGYVEGKAEFVEKLVSKTSDFVSIQLSNQKIYQVDHTIIVRHDLDAETNDNGKQGKVSLHVLSVWQKQHGKWKMIARQATKRPM